MTVEVDMKELEELIQLLLRKVTKLRQGRPTGELFEATLLQKLSAVREANLTASSQP